MRLPSPAHLRARASWLIRDRFPHRKVVRVVQGVEMTLPWSHRLPDYAAGASPYGQNLVRLAQRLSSPQEPLVVVDIGANVGDSALQVLDATDARIVCVEADDYYLDYLRINVGQRSDCAIEPALLVPDASTSSNVSAVRSGGTAHFVEDGSAALSAVTPAQLRARHPWLAGLRLVKSDTDGYDVALVPALAREFQDRAPVLFFEYDVHLTRAAGHDPLRVWGELQELGYTEVAVWDNGGLPLGRTSVEAMASATGRLDEPDLVARHAYWDVAVVHGGDDDARAALDDLIPVRL